MSTIGHPKIKTNMEEWHFSSKGKTYVYLVFYTRLNKMSCEKNFHEGNWIQGHKCKIKYFSHSLFTNCKGKWLFTTKRAKFSKFFLLFYIVHFEMPFGRKNTIKWMNLIYLPIFNRLPFILLFTIELIFVSNFVKIYEWSTWTCFLLDMLF